MYTEVFMSELDYWLKKIDDRIFNLEVTIILTGDVNSKKKLIKLMGKEIEKKKNIRNKKKNGKKRIDKVLYFTCYFDSSVNRNFFGDLVLFSTN